MGGETKWVFASFLRVHACHMRTWSWDPDPLDPCLGSAPDQLGDLEQVIVSLCFSFLIWKMGAALLVIHYL